MAVDRLPVRKVEVAARHRLEEPLGDELPLRRVQRPGVPDVQPVAENGKARGGSSSPGRSFCGDAPAAPELPFDVRAAILGWPPLTLEHLEHGKLVGRKGVSLDRLQVGGFRQPPVHGDIPSAANITLRPGHVPNLSQRVPAGDRNVRSEPRKSPTPAPD